LSTANYSVFMPISHTKRLLFCLHVGGCFAQFMASWHYKFSINPNPNAGPNPNQNTIREPRFALNTGGQRRKVR